MIPNMYKIAGDGINMTTAMQNREAAVDAGHWLLYRHHPQRARNGENPLQFDSRSPKIPIGRSLYLENHFKTLTKSKPEEAGRLLEEAQKDAQTRWRIYERLSARRTATARPLRTSPSAFINLTLTLTTSQSGQT